MNTSHFLIRFLLLLGGAFPVVSNAALLWENSQLQLTAMAGTPEIATAFSFRNTGDTPVTITGLRTSCSCTTAEVEKPNYAPGESGRIEIRFHPEERTGLVDRTITVTTDDQSTVTMSLRVNLFEPVVCSAKTLTWKKGTPALEQAVEIAANAPSLIRAIELESGDLEKFANAQVETIEPSQRYRLLIAPLDPRQSRETPLHCRIEFTDGSIRRLVISTVIK